MKFLQAIQKNLAIAIPITMILGVLTSLLGDMSFLKVTILPITFLMVYPMMVTLPMKKLKAKGNVQVQWAAFLLNFTVSPFIALGIGNWFFPESPYMKLAILLMGLIPTSGMTIAWTGMGGGNRLEAIKMTVIGLLAGAVLTPLYASGLLGAEVSLPLGKIAIQILSVVIVPLILGAITQKIILSRVSEEKFQKELKPKISLISTVGVIVMVFAAMAIKGKGLVKNPQILLSAIPAIIVFYAGIFVAGAAVARIFFAKSEGIALIYGTAMRNLSIVLAIAMSLFGKNGSGMALILSLAYVIQIQSAVLFMKVIPLLWSEKRAVEPLAEVE